MHTKVIEGADLDLMAGLTALIEKAKTNVAALEEARDKIVGETPRKRGPGRPRKGEEKRVIASAPLKRRRRNRRKGGTRADQAVKLIQDRPGISASDLALEMKIKPNYLYRVLGEMSEEGRVRKAGRQYYPVTKLMKQGAKANG